MRCRFACLALLLACIFTMSACVDPLFSVASHSARSSSTTPKIVTLLSGASWTLVHMSAGGKSQPLIPTAPVTLQFQHDGAYLGSSGCNYYNGAYAIAGGQLHLQFKGVTQKACAGPIMSQEVTYLNAMAQARSYQINDQTLALEDASGRVILVYTAA